MHIQDDKPKKQGYPVYMELRYGQMVRIRYDQNDWTLSEEMADTVSKHGTVLVNGAVRYGKRAQTVVLLGNPANKTRKSHVYPKRI